LALTGSVLVAAGAVISLVLGLSSSAEILVANLGLAAVVALLGQLIRAVRVSDPVTAILDRAAMGALSVALSLFCIGYGGLTSPLFLAVGVLVFLRVLVVGSSTRRTLTTALLMWLLFPLTLGAAAAFSAPLEASWSDADELVRFLFSNTAILGFAGLGLIIRQARPLPRLNDEPLVELEFEVVRKIGEGATGAVYLARQTGLGRDCAVKILHSELVGDPEARRRFTKEMAGPARINHPNLITIYGSRSLPDGRLLYAMEYLDGLSLREVLERSGPQPSGRVIHVVAQVAEALEAAHEAGIVHGNLNLDNVLLTRRGSEFDFVKVLDFGRSSAIQSQARSRPVPAEVRAEDFEGDPHFIAPEIVLGRAPGPRADIYSLGVMAFYLLSDQPLFPYKSASKILMAQVQEDPPTITRVAHSFIPPELEFVLTRSLSKLPDYRYKTIAKFRQALLSCNSGAPWTRTDARNWWIGLESPDRQQSSEPGSSGSSSGGGSEGSGDVGGGTIPTVPELPGGRMLN
jgi:serine/threonine protein kinase